jgi:hypothetical protein
MFERIATSWELAKSSWHVLRTDKKLIVFPILSGIAATLVTATFVVPFLFQPQWAGWQMNQQANGGFNGGFQPQWWFYVILFAYYFCNYFVIIFFNSALISCALLRFHGEEPTIGDGLRAATSRLPQILAWAAVSATVGVLLKLVENVHERVGEIVSAILGTVWSVITYFVVPVLVVEKVGPIEAVKRSMSLLKKTWGEALVGHWGVGLIVFLMMIPGILLFIIGAMLCMANPAVGLVVLGLAIVYLLIAGAAGSALHGIFLAALYQYAAYGEVPDGFEKRALRRAFATK